MGILLRGRRKVRKLESPQVGKTIGERSKFSFAILITICSLPAGELPVPRFYFIASGYHRKITATAQQSGWLVFVFLFVFTAFSLHLTSRLAVFPTFRLPGYTSLSILINSSATLILHLLLINKQSRGPEAASSIFRNFSSCRQRRRHLFPL